MKIGEIARAAGVTTSRIRFYERRGLLPSATRTANGYRDYPVELVSLLRFVELAQSLGFTLREIGQVRPHEGEHFVSCEEGIRLLSAKLNAVDALILEAEQRKARIQSTIAELRVVQEGRNQGASAAMASRGARRPKPIQPEN